MTSKWPRFLGKQRYELIDPVGTGGMAAVFRARDLFGKRDCAVKLLLPSAARSQKTRHRFLTEARTMAVLDHANVVRILDVGQEDEHYFFVMELAAGGSLADYLRRHGARGPREALALVYQVLMGLDYAHTAGVVHRDIKPHNMLLEVPPDPARDADANVFTQRQVVKLTDFGIAKHIAASQGSRITGTGDTLGTLAYMPPEQRVDPRRAGPEADIYGVGATLYILVTGRRPFDLAMAGMDPTVMERLHPAIRPIVRTATATRPEDRYPTARHMGEAVAATWAELDPGAVDRQRMVDDFDLAGDTIVAPHTIDEG